MAKLVVCPDCQKQISDTAKTCPYCGADRRRIRSVAGGFISLFIMLLCCVAIPLTETRGSIEIPPARIALILLIIASIVSMMICFTKPSN